MNDCVMDFGRRWLGHEDCKRNVIEFGSRNVNGSLRNIVTQHQPASYLGIDLEAGNGVDLVLDAIQAPSHLGVNVADVLICTEVLEHVENWKALVYATKDMTKPGGVLLLSTRSEGFPKHDYPNDFWRFSTGDLVAIFDDLEIMALQMDTQEPGAMIVCRKPLVPWIRNCLDIMVPAEAPSA